MPWGMWQLFNMEPGKLNGGCGRHDNYILVDHN